jgi:hypothetical protein
MSYTSNLKKVVDLPVWEWMRVAPATTSALTCLTAANTLNNRYLYYLATNTLFRYDTHTDCWQQLASSINVNITLIEAGYTSAMGHPGRAIAGGASTITLAGLGGNALVGQKIRITGGTGAGQERTITAVSAPTIHDRGIVVGSSTSSIIDSSSGILTKTWRPNKWRDYQVRVFFGTFSGLVRPILQNSGTTLFFSDAGTNVINVWNAPTASGTVPVNSFYQIESHVATVDSPWDVQPDSTSTFMIMSGGLWSISSNAGGFCIHYYDVLGDYWYQKSNVTGHLGAIGTAIAFERFTESGGAILTGLSATSAAARTLTNSLANMGVNRYANMEIRITSGIAKGQIKTILANSPTTFYFASPFNVTPNADDTYEVWRDCGKLLVAGMAGAPIQMYTAGEDLWASGRIFDVGISRPATVTGAGFAPMGVVSITRTSNLYGATAINPIPSSGGTGYQVGQMLTLGTPSGGVGASAVITDVSSTGAVTGVALVAPGAPAVNGYITGNRSTTVTPVGGTGCIVNVTAVGEIATVTLSSNAPFKLGDSVTIAGAVQSDYNGSKSIIGIPTATTFNFSLGVAAPVTPATFTAIQSTTTVADIAKNWIPNEHVGKILTLTSTVGQTVAATHRVIASNTSNTITVVGTNFTPTVGVSQYLIQDIRCFGTEMSVGARTGGGRSGFASGGSTSTLVDASKNWPPAYWIGRKVQIVAGTGIGAILTITANSATTLTYATQTFTPDATTVYQIHDCFGVATGGSGTTLVDTTQNWGTNIHVGKQVKYTIAATGAWVYATVTSNTSNTLTFATATAPDATSAYSILESQLMGAGIHMDCVTGCSDPSINNRYLYKWTGGGSAQLTRYDFTTEQFETLVYFPQGETLNAGSMFAYDGVDRIYFTKDISGRVFYYDVVKNLVVPFGVIPYGMGVAVIGNRMEVIESPDGVRFLYIMRHTGVEMWRALIP